MRVLAGAVKGVQTMSKTPTEEDVVDILRKFKEYQALTPLATLVNRSERTLYRHAEDDDTRPAMGGATLMELAELFVELDLIENRDFSSVARAVKEIRARASRSPVNAEGDVDEALGNGDGGALRPGNS
jgi:hypothetical protein